MGNPPDFKERSRRFDIAFWKPTEDGKSGSISMQRSRKDKEGSWLREGIRFFPNEIEDVEKVITEMKAYLRKEGIYPPNEQ